MFLTEVLRPVSQRSAYCLGEWLSKQADDAPVPDYSMSGPLYLSSSGWLLLGVPNSLVRGAFAAMDETGIELPPSGPNGFLNAHVSVFRPEELERIGGPEKVTERGKTFRYRLGGLYSLVPAGWKEMERVWMLKVHSTELQELRRSYGLSSLPNEGKFAFHITVACRRRGVLSRNEKTKG